MVDRMYNVINKSTKGSGDKEKERESNYLELSCLRCGKRWSIRKGNGAFARWLERMEKRLESAHATFT